MDIVLIVVAAVVVVAIAIGTVQVVSRGLAGQEPTAIFEVEDAVEWIADRLPFEVAAEVSHADVRQIIFWHLDWFDEVGLASEFGEELGGSVATSASDADGDAAIDYVIDRSRGTDITELQVVVVLDKQMDYLRHIGAIDPV